MESNSAPATRILLIDGLNQLHTIQECLSAAKSKIYSEFHPRWDLVVHHQFDAAEAAVRIGQRDNQPFALAYVDVASPSAALEASRALERIWSLDPYIHFVLVTSADRNTSGSAQNGFPRSDKLLFLKKPLDEGEIHQLTITLARKWSLETGSGKERSQPGRARPNNNILPPRVVDEPRLNHELFASMVKQSLDAIIMHDGNHILYANRQAYELFDYEQESLIGLDWRLLAHPDSLTILKERVKRRLESEEFPSHYECKLIRRDGSTIHAEINAGSVMIGREKVIQAWIKDSSQRKEYEEKIIRAKQEWEQTFDAVSTLIFITGPDQGIIRVNSAVASRLSTIPENLIGLKCNQVFGCDFSSDHHCPYYQRAITEKNISHELRLPKLEGEFEVHISPLPASSGEIRGMVHVANDITERKKAEYQLAQSLALQTATLESTGDGILVVGRGGRVEGYNHTFLTMWNLSEEQVDGRSAFGVLDLIGDQVLFFETVRKKTLSLAVQLEGEGRIQFEFKDGRVLDMNTQPQRVAGEIVGRVWTFRDITLRVQAEQALKESEEKYRLLVEKAGDAIAVIQDKKFKFVNAKLLQMTGVPRSRLIGQNFFVWVHPTDRAMLLDYYRGCLQGEPMPDQYEVRLLDVDGDIIWTTTRTVFIDWEGRTALLFFISDNTERKRAEQALAESEEKYRVIVDHSLSGIFIVQSGLLHYVNPQFLRIFGYDREDEIIGLSFWEIVHPEDRKLFREAGLRSESGESITKDYDCRCIGKDGRTILVNMLATRATFMDRPAVIGSIIDITEKLQAQDAARALENRFQVMVRQFPLSTIIFRPDGTPITVNQAFYLLWGMAEHQLPRLLNEYNVFDDPNMKADNLMTHLEKAFNGKTSAMPPVLYQAGRQTFLVGLLPKEKWVRGFVYPVRSESGQVREVVLVHEDITDRIRAEEAVKESENRYKDLFNNITDIVYTHDLNGVILTINRAASKILGYDVQELVGRHMIDIIHPSQRPAFQGLYLDQLLEKGFCQGVSKYISRSGDKHYLEFSSSLITRAYGRPLYVQGSARDITARLAAEKEMKNLEAQLLHSQKMEAVGTLAGGVAHDFNNLLAGIVVNLDMAMSKKDIDVDLNRYLTTAVAAAERARDLTRHLLTFSRKTEPDKKALLLTGPIRETVRLLSRTLDRRIQIEVLIADDLAFMEADEGQMIQVVMNLCVNARDAVEKSLFDPECGPQTNKPYLIAIKAGNVTLTQQDIVPHSDATPGRFIEMTVSDNGCGMDEDMVARIFEPFFTTKPLHKGTGLGLSTVYGIVKQHRGWITVDSSPTKGTAFKLYFPAFERTAEEKAAPEPRDTLPRGNETILLVDDEEMIREFGMEFLSDLGYSVILAEDGAEAVNIFEEKMEAIDLVVLDMVMPKMSGQEVLRKILKMAPATKIIISSGHDPDDTRNDLVVNSSAYVAKPYHIRELASVVRRVLDAE